MDIKVPAIRQDLVDAAAAVTSAAHDRAKQARAALGVADAALRAATAACVAAKGDALTLARAERDANDEFLFAQRVVTITEQQHAAAQKAQAEAWGEAHRPIHDAGVAIRLAAVRRADAARAELAAAGAEFVRGTTLVKYAREKGCKATAGLDGGLIDRPLHSDAHALANSLRPQMVHNEAAELALLGGAS